jgi:ATP-binding cassette subfamily B protein
MSQNKKSMLPMKGGPGRPGSHGKRVENPLKVLKRLLAYVLKEYKFLFF